MRFSQEFIERVRDANNLVDIISQFTQLKPTGSSLMGRCPFPDHQEKSPSFSVSDSKQVYHCFGCHKSGNIFTFLQQYQGMNFPEAVEYLAQRAQIPLPKEDDFKKTDNSNLEKKKAIQNINNIATNFFYNNLKKLPSNHSVIQYVQKRGLSPEIIEAFQIGYALPEWDALTSHLKSKNISLELAEEAKLVKAKQKQDGFGFYDLFRDRLMFPIFSPMGEPLAYGGRSVGIGDPKYLNSPETPIFVKGKVLYGLYQTAKYIRSEDQAIIVEGYMDLVSLYQAGIRNVVATMGTALTPEHGKLLKRLTKNVVTLFDGDEAGQAASERSLPILLKEGLLPRGLVLPNNMDPDDYVKSNGAEELQKLIDQSQDLFNLILMQWLRDFKGEASEKIQICDRIKPILAEIPDQRLKELYITNLAQKLSVSMSWLRSALSDAGSNAGTRSNTFKMDYTKKSNPSATPNSLTEDKPKTMPTQINEYVEGAEVISLKGAPKVETTMLALALKSRAIFEIILKENYINFILHEGVKRIFNKAIEVYRQDHTKFDKLVSLLVSFVDVPDLLFYKEAKYLVESDENLENESELELKLLKDYVRRVREQYLRDQLRKITTDLKLNPNEEKLEQLKLIQKEINSLNRG